MDQPRLWRPELEWTRRRFLRNAFWSASVIGLGGTLGACGDDDTVSDTTAGPGSETTAGTAPTVTEAGGKKVLRLPLEEPGFAAPGTPQSADLGSSFLGHVCFSGLWVFDANRAIVPSDVESYTPSDDLMTHTIALKPGLKWSDGTPYDATTYEWSVQYMQTTYGNIADRWLKGIPELQDGASDDVTTIGWHAADENTLVVETLYPVNFFEIWAGGRPFFVVQPRHNIEAFGDAEYALLPHIACNGPYMVAEWDNTVSMLLTRNPNYVGPPAVPDEIEITIFAQAQDTEAFNAFLGNQIDVANVPAPNLQTVDADPELSEYRSVQTYADVTFVLCNTTKPPLDDVRVRQALYMAIDREQLATEVLQDNAVPAYGFISPAMQAGYDADARPFDDISVEAAQALLAEAGYPNGDGFPTLTYIDYQASTISLISQFVQEQWRTNLGIEIEIQALDPGSWFQAVILVDPTADWGHLAIAFWPSDYPEASEIVGQLFDFGGAFVYHHHWEKSPELEQQQVDALFASDAATRSQLLNEYNLAVVREAPIVPLVHPVQVQVRQPDVTGGYYFYGTEFYQVRYLDKAG